MAEASNFNCDARVWQVQGDDAAALFTAVIMSNGTPGNEYNDHISSGIGNSEFLLLLPACMQPTSVCLYVHNEKHVTFSSIERRVIQAQVNCLPQNNVWMELKVCNSRMYSVYGSVQLAIHFLLLIGRGVGCFCWSATMHHWQNAPCPLSCHLLPPTGRYITSFYVLQLVYQIGISSISYRIYLYTICNGHLIKSKYIFIIASCSASKRTTHDRCYLLGRMEGSPSQLRLRSVVRIM